MAGILNNRLYTGEMVWNRQQYVKNPDTGRRVSRRNPTSALVVTPVPLLRIVPDDLWEAAKARQGETRRMLRSGHEPRARAPSGVSPLRADEVRRLRQRVHDVLERSTRLRGCSRPRHLNEPTHDPTRRGRSAGPQGDGRAPLEPGAVRGVLPGVHARGIDSTVKPRPPPQPQFASWRNRSPPHGVSRLDLHSRLAYE